MKNNAIAFLLGLSVLALGAGAEELLPKFLGTGFPVLLAATLYFAVNRPVVESTLFALAAGGAVDALSSLPPMTGAGFFAAAALAVRFAPFPWLATAVAYPFFQVWIAVWAGGVGGSLFLRLLLAVPVGLMTGVATGLALSLVERKAAVYEES